MNKKILFAGLILLIALSSSSTAKRLYTWGEAMPINLNTENKTLSSFDGFDFVYSNKGYFDVWKEGEHQGRFSFGLFGVINSSQEKKLMSDFDWSWQVIEENQNVISVRAYNNFQPFKWWMDLNVYRYKPLKISHRIENNTGNDATNLQMFYLVDANQETNPYIYYEKKDGSTLAYDYSTNQHFTQGDTNFAKFYDKVSLGSFQFFYNDIIENGFFVTRAFFGNLDDLDETLPDTNGFALGFSKGNKTLQQGQAYEIDPTLTVADAYEGHIEYKSVTGNYTVRTTQIKAGHDATGTYEIFRAIMEFDLSTLQQVISANLFLTKWTNQIGTNTSTFDLNSVVSVDEWAGPGIDWNSDGGDWNSPTFEIVLDDWHDETLGTDDNLSGNVTTAWNNAIDAGRDYLSFKYLQEADEADTGAGGGVCGAVFCDDLWYGWIDNAIAPSNAPYIEYTTLNVNLKVPETPTYFGDGNTTDGNAFVVFSVRSTDNNHMLADLYYSSDANTFENLIVKDLNLHWFGNDVNGNQTSEISCDSNDFTSAVDCSYDFNFLSIPDGNYFIDVNIHNEANDNNKTASSNESFQVDFNKPTTAWDGNHNTWQSVDANAILTCVDASENCPTQQFQIDTEPTVFITFGSTQTSSSMNVPEGGGDIDGNWAVRFRSTDIVGNTGDWNQQFVLIDRTSPTIVSFVPDNNVSTTDTSPDFNVEFSDLIGNSNSGISTCDYNIYIERVLTQSGSETAIDSKCKTTLTTDLTNGQEANVEWEGIDTVGNRSGRQIGFPRTYTTPTPPTTGGGGGTSTVTRLFSFLLREPANKSITKIMLEGTKSEFELKVKNEEELPIIVTITVDENISHIVECEERVEIKTTTTETILCTIDTTDVNMTGIQTDFEGKVTIKTASTSDEVIVKVIVVSADNWLIQIYLAIKENPNAFAGAVVLLIATASIALLGVVGTIKHKAGQMLAIFGGGSTAFFLLLLIII